MNTAEPAPADIARSALDRSHRQWREGNRDWVYLGLESEPSVREWRNHLLNCLPPVRGNGLCAFLVGEAFSHGVVAGREVAFYQSVRTTPTGHVWTRLETCAEFERTPNHSLPSPPSAKPRARFTKIRSDRHGDREGWSWVFVIGVEGELETNPEDRRYVSDDEIRRIIRWMADEHGWHVIHDHNDGAGQPYAHEATFDFFPTTIVVRQHGGLDV